MGIVEKVSAALGLNAASKVDAATAKLEDLRRERDRLEARADELEKRKLEACEDASRFGELAAELTSTRVELERTELLIARAEAALEEAKRAELLETFEVAKRALGGPSANLALAANELLEAEQAASRARAAFATAWEAYEQAYERARDAAEAAGVSPPPNGPDDLKSFQGEGVRDAVDIIDRPDEVRSRRHNPITNPFGLENIVLPSGDELRRGLIGTARNVLKYSEPIVGIDRTFYGE